MRASAKIDFPAGMQVFERGWLSSNCVLFADEPGGTLIDTGYCTHVEQTYAMVRHAVERHANPTLRRIINTHLHSDHCGGNRVIAKRMVCDVLIPEGSADAVRTWDHRRLSFEATGQHCDRFEFDDTVSPGDILTMGELEWEALAAPGHDGDALMFHCEDEGILITGDALWEDGCGVIFPTDQPRTTEQDFTAAFETLDLIDSLPVRIVVPGHGRPFTDVEGAVDRARSRMRHLSADRSKNARHVLRVLLKYRLLDLRRMTLADVCTMFRTVPALLYAGRDIGASPDDLARATIDDLVRARVARFEDDVLFDA